MTSLKVIQGSERAVRVRSRFPEPLENEKQTGAKVGRAPSATPTAEEKKMSTRTDAVSTWHLATLPAAHRGLRPRPAGASPEQGPTPHLASGKVIATSTRAGRPSVGRQEVWAGAVYLMVWSLLWLAVIVTVLAPLDGLFGGAR
jgi:hypothetical protein